MIKSKVQTYIDDLKQRLQDAQELEDYEAIENEADAIFIHLNEIDIATTIHTSSLKYADGFPAAVEMDMEHYLTSVKQITIDCEEMKEAGEQEGRDHEAHVKSFSVPC